MEKLRVAEWVVFIFSVQDVEAYLSENNISAENIIPGATDGAASMVDQYRRLI